ncbi:GSCOCG00008050001-RA-CDS [Cotesia congregata]|uniref:Uncharacterized protein n=1 Tax=Cotesia congregata TaxID=51543 RepID=A0A8J2HR51_COTCN|nr:GSCOCG00008050001-RA-CDS [Cotesia congregata]CAG5109109.1 Protein of unknown function [Cotesia congregata]
MENFIFREFESQKNPRIQSNWVCVNTQMEAVQQELSKIDFKWLRKSITETQISLGKESLSSVFEIPTDAAISNGTNKSTTAGSIKLSGKKQYGKADQHSPT